MEILNVHFMFAQIELLKDVLTSCTLKIMQCLKFKSAAILEFNDLYNYYFENK